MLIGGGYILCYKIPQKPPFSKDSLNLLISLILHDKDRLYLLGMKIAVGSMTMISELRRGIEQD